MARAASSASVRSGSSCQARCQWCSARSTRPRRVSHRPATWRWRSARCGARSGVWLTGPRSSPSRCSVGASSAAWSRSSRVSSSASMTAAASAKRPRAMRCSDRRWAACSWAGSWARASRRSRSPSSAWPSRRRISAGLGQEVGGLRRALHVDRVNLRDLGQLGGLAGLAQGAPQLAVELPGVGLALERLELGTQRADELGLGRGDVVAHRSSLWLTRERPADPWALRVSPPERSPRRSDTGSCGMTPWASLTSFASGSLIGRLAQKWPYPRDVSMGRDGRGSERGG